MSEQLRAAAERLREGRIGYVTSDQWYADSFLLRDAYLAANPPDDEPAEGPQAAEFELPDIVRGPCQLTNGHEWVVFTMPGSIIPPPNCPWIVPEGFAAVRWQPAGERGEVESLRARLGEVEAEVSRLKYDRTNHFADVRRLSEWVKGTKPAVLSFTDGPERQAAYLIEGERRKAEAALAAERERVERLEAALARIRPYLVEANSDHVKDIDAALTPKEPPDGQ